MQTELDSCYEILFDGLGYDGSILTIEVNEQFVQKNRNIGPTSASHRFLITVANPRSFLVIEEFPASVANLLAQNGNPAFLRTIENPAFVEALGLNSSSEESPILQCFALITSHEVIVIFANEVPSVVHKDERS